VPSSMPIAGCRFSATDETNSSSWRA